MVQLGEDLRGGATMALARIAQAVVEDGAQGRGVRGDDVRLLLQLQPLDEVAKGREAGGDEGSRGGGRDGDADAFEDVGLAALGDAVVLDARLERVEQLQALVDVGRGLLERSKQRGRLLFHDGRATCAVDGRVFAGYMRRLVV